MTGLICGFEPFGTLTTNPSLVVAEHVASQLPGGVFVELPTSFRRVTKRLDDAIERENPNFAIMFGYAASPDLSWICRGWRPRLGGRRSGLILQSGRTKPRVSSRVGAGSTGRVCCGSQ